VVFLPVIIVLYGIEDESKIVLIAIVVFFQILVVVRDEALNVPPELVESVRSLGAGRRALYWYVYLPSSFGAVLTGWRVSVGTAVAVLFIAETTAGSLGLGYYITNSWFRLRYPQMYIGILAMSLLGIILYLATDVLERLFRRWKYV
jgi:NitT/TauT family transport system permease protein